MPQLQELMACLLYQLRESRPDLVQDGSHRIETAISSEAWQDADEQIALEAMRACMLSLPGLFDANEEITLVLDRVNKCCSANELVNGQVLLMQLMKLVMAAPCVLKILVVTSATSWKISPNQRERLRIKGGSYRVDNLDWHQQSGRSMALTAPTLRNRG